MEYIKLLKDSLPTDHTDYENYLKISNLCDFGYVRFIDFMGTDYEIAKTAKQCYGKYDTRLTKDEVIRIINLLTKKKHYSPFEFARITFMVKAPIFIARQWLRHRTFSYMERSGRYTNLNEMECYRKFKSDKSIEIADESITCSMQRYSELIENKESLEEARTILPIGTFTEFMFSADIRNLLHFLELRLSTGAQKEMQLYANAVATITQYLFPITWEAFEEHVLYAETLSRSEFKQMTIKR